MPQPIGKPKSDSTYCQACLHGRGELIYYASCQNHCAVCGSALIPVDFAGTSGELPSVKDILDDPSASS